MYLWRDRQIANTKQSGRLAGGAKSEAYTSGQLGNNVDNRLITLG